MMTENKNSFSSINLDLYLSDVLKKDSISSIHRKLSQKMDVLLEMYL